MSSSLLLPLVNIYTNEFSTISYDYSTLSMFIYTCGAFDIDLLELLKEESPEVIIEKLNKTVKASNGDLYTLAEISIVPHCTKELPNRVVERYLRGIPADVVTHHAFEIISHYKELVRRTNRFDGSFVRFTDKKKFILQYRLHEHLDKLDSIINMCYKVPDNSYQLANIPFHWSVVTELSSKLIKEVDLLKEEILMNIKSQELLTNMKLDDDTEYEDTIPQRLNRIKTLVRIVLGNSFVLEERGKETMRRCYYILPALECLINLFDFLEELDGTIHKNLKSFIQSRIYIPNTIAQAVSCHLISAKATEINYTPSYSVSMPPLFSYGIRRTSHIVPRFGQRYYDIHAAALV